MILQKVQYPDERAVVPAEARKIPHHDDMGMSAANRTHHEFQTCTMNTIAVVLILRRSSDDISLSLCFFQQLSHLCSQYTQALASAATVEPHRAHFSVFRHIASLLCTKK